MYNYCQSITNSSKKKPKYTQIIMSWKFLLHFSFLLYFAFATFIIYNIWVFQVSYDFDDEKEIHAKKNLAL